jgi:hypothetical protein
VSPTEPRPEPHAWYPTVLAFVGAGPLAGGLAFLIETIILQGTIGGHMPTISELPLALRVLVAAYVFGIVPTALAGYFHFYAHSWLHSALARNIATCALGGFLAVLLAILGGQGGVILAYGLAGAVAAAACIVLTDRLFPRRPA